MRTSVVVPTYNREEQIISLLKALEVQTYQDFETIVVIDGSSDNTANVIERFKEKTTLTLNVYAIANKGRAGSRNFGVEQSKGDLIIFFDDDTRPNPKAVFHHLQCHLTREKVLVSGPYLYDRSKFRNDFNYFRACMEAKWIVNSDDLIPCNNLRINGGNFSIRKRDFVHAGGFDERLRDKEDFKFSFDFKKICRGEVFCFYPAWVYHDDFKGLLAYIERERASRLEEQRLAELEPEIGILFPERFIVNPPREFKYKIGRMLKVKPFIILFERALNMGFGSKSFRNRVYDMVITMNIKYL